MSAPPDQHEEFISEAIRPEPGSFDALAMSRGEPGLPAAFTWRGGRYVVHRLISAWKTSTPDRGEMYLRRHWYAVETTSGQRMTLYCQRQAGSAARRKQRWWLYSIAVPGPSATAH